MMTTTDLMSFWIIHWIRRHKWLLLLLGMVTLLFLSPVSRQVFDEHDDLITPMITCIFLAVTFGTTENWRTTRLVTTLILVWFVISSLTEGSGLFAGRSVLAPVFFMFLLVAIFVLLARWMMRVAQIDAEVIYAAVCGYLLIGVLWTVFYSVVLFIDHKAFIAESGTPVNTGDLLYYSYTTLTTTGFGDILPRNPHVRMLSVMEAIVGTFYNTIVIARFVGLYGLKTQHT